MSSICEEEMLEKMKIIQLRTESENCNGSISRKTTDMSSQYEQEMLSMMDQLRSENWNCYTRSYLNCNTTEILAPHEKTSSIYKEEMSSKMETMKNSILNCKAMESFRFYKGIVSALEEKQEKKKFVRNEALEKDFNYFVELYIKDRDIPFYRASFMRAVCGVFFVFLGGAYGAYIHNKMIDTNKETELEKVKPSPKVMTVERKSIFQEWLKGNYMEDREMYGRIFDRRGNL